MKNVIALVFMIIMIILIILFCNNRADNCIKKGGTVVTDTYGLFDKCIYEKEE